MRSYIPLKRHIKVIELKWIVNFTVVVLRSFSDDRHVTGTSTNPSVAPWLSFHVHIKPILAGFESSVSAFYLRFSLLIGLGLFPRYECNSADCRLASTPSLSLLYIIMCTIKAAIRYHCAAAKISVKPGTRLSRSSFVMLFSVFVYYVSKTNCPLNIHGDASEPN